MTGAAATAGATARAFFLPSPSGRVFAVHHLPRDPAAIRGHVLLVPPFNEEMNRCRSMMTLQAQAFALLGYGTLVVDLHGTGDSEGEFRDARWELWLDDLQAMHQWLQDQPGGCRALLGIRLGAILAAQLLSRLQAADTALMFWQPVLDGKTHLTQFLRVRMAAQLDRPNLPKETTASMRQQFAAGENVEVAGYEIHPDLARALDGARLADFRPPSGTRVAWLERMAGEAAELSPVNKKLVDDWTVAGVALEILMFPGPAFWEVHERVTAPAAIEHTRAWFEKAGSGR
jgi:exosortase A-associated hydrolase 2